MAVFTEDLCFWDPNSNKPVVRFIDSVKMRLLSTVRKCSTRAGTSDSIIGPLFRKAAAVAKQLGYMEEEIEKLDPEEAKLNFRTILYSNLKTLWADLFAHDLHSLQKMSSRFPVNLSQNLGGVSLPGYQAATLYHETTPKVWRGIIGGILNTVCQGVSGKVKPSIRSYQYIRLLGSALRSNPHTASQSKIQSIEFINSTPLISMDDLRNRITQELMGDSEDSLHLQRRLHGVNIQLCGPGVFNRVIQQRLSERFVSVSDVFREIDRVQEFEELFARGVQDPGRKYITIGRYKQHMTQIQDFFLSEVSKGNFNLCFDDWATIILSKTGRFTQDFSRYLAIISSPGFCETSEDSVQLVYKDRMTLRVHNVAPGNRV
eukprot:991427_1